MCVPHERDIYRVMHSLVESGSTVAEAVVQARSDANKKHIRKEHKADMPGRLRKIYEDYKMKSDAASDRGEKAFFL